MNPYDDAGRPAPVEIRYKSADRLLEVEFENDVCHRLPAEFLRVESPSAEVQGHSPSQRVTIAGRRQVAIAEIEPVGNYAIRIRFDDGHASGIYSWSYLYEIGVRQDEIWRAYLDALVTQGLSRDR